MIRRLLGINAVIALVLCAVWGWVTFAASTQTQTGLMQPPTSELSALLIERGITIEVDYEVRVYGEPEPQAMLAVLDQYGPFLVYNRDGERIGTYTATGLTP